MNQDEVRQHLDALDWGPHGLTRHEIRDSWPDLPDALYLHLPDSKRFDGAAAVLREAERSDARAEGEFTPANDDTPTDGAVADGGPPAWGVSSIASSSGVVNAGGNDPLPEV